MLNIVLFEPEIPQNTGNIGRTCVATNTRLHIIEPIGFDLGEKAIRRSGMDYWQHLDIHIYKNYGEFLEKNPDAKENLYMGTTKAPKAHTEATFTKNAYIMFGKESAGIPEEILVGHKEKSIRIPMNNKVRSLNLATSAAIVLYEALRQTGYESMEVEGKLHHLEWED